ncbi:hypothetical protein O181_014654 [Austropuccinia psidii MF-1]|uniref:Uncharacterized protein n=1 Tax=Austropuccinia psidii MF-1 TaxID=1389203 RepID=A0A9Q3GQ27_9BASI|nr:hypothetical protein [Austropuccinia psidii MF-1]
MLRWQIAIQEYRGNITIVPNAGEEAPQIPIEGINLTDVGDELVKEVREYYHQGQSCINCWQMTSRRPVWVMSRLRQDNVNFHMCHMRMSLKAQAHFHTICNVWVITPHGATQEFGRLILAHEETSAPPPGHLTPFPCLISCMRLRHCPPISILTTPYASASPPHLLLGLQCLRCCGALKLCLQCCAHPPLHLLAPAQHALNSSYNPCTHSSLPTCLQHSLPSLRLWSAFPTCLQCRLPSLHLYSAHPTGLQPCLPSLRLQCPPDMPLMLLTILTLTVTSQNASDPAYHPSPCICPPKMPPRPPSHWTDPYAPQAPSR